MAGLKMEEILKWRGLKSQGSLYPSIPRPPSIKDQNFLAEWGGLKMQGPLYSCIQMTFGDRDA